MHDESTQNLSVPVSPFRQFHIFLHFLQYIEEHLQFFFPNACRKPLFQQGNMPLHLLLHFHCMSGGQYLFQTVVTGNLFPADKVPAPPFFSKARKRTRFLCSVLPLCPSGRSPCPDRTPGQSSESAPVYRTALWLYQRL